MANINKFDTVSINDVLKNINHSYLLPAIQRKFVWKSEQIEKLFDSIMQGYPINTFMFWKITDKNIKNDHKFYDFLLDYIEHFEEDFDVTQHCDNEYPQSQSYDPGTSSSIMIGKTAYDFVVHSEVRLYRDDEEQSITVTYHFTELMPSSENYNQDDYYLVITFPYNKKTWTAIDNVECSQSSIEYYDLQGRKLDAPQPGIIIEKHGNVTRKKLYR